LLPRVWAAELAEVERLKNRLHEENVYLQEEIRTQHNFEEIVGRSPALLEALTKVEKVAPTDATVLLLGETGTGKELFARALHSRSARKDRPLVKVNCGAIPAGLVESELFGHVRGAFTGALEKRTGRFELAHGGTLFLDEIGELPLETQVKLLRVLQEQEFEPVGSSRTVRVDVRVLAASNRDLEEAVREGRFRATCWRERETWDGRAGARTASGYMSAGGTTACASGSPTGRSSASPSSQTSDSRGPGSQDCGVGTAPDGTTLALRDVSVMSCPAFPRTGLFWSLSTPPGTDVRAHAAADRRRHA
jgi:Sigma-54 interaction domain